MVRPWTDRVLIILSSVPIAIFCNILRIVVWHHPIRGREQLANDDFVELLRNANYKICLHGHVHELRTELMGYTHRKTLDVIGAGSFGASFEQRPESTPRLYNLLEIAADRSKISVHTRKREKPNGAWTGAAYWSTGKDNLYQSFYPIDLKKND